MCDRLGMSPVHSCCFCSGCPRLLRFVWPISGPRMVDPVCASQTRSVLSSEPDTIFFPSGENVTDLTKSVWPINGPRMVNPDSASQTRSVLSKEPDTIFFPSGEKATDATEFVWPV